MSRVIEMTNISNKVVTVVLKRGHKVDLKPNEKLRDEDVENLDEVR